MNHASPTEIVVAIVFMIGYVGCIFFVGKSEAKKLKTEIDKTKAEEKDLK